MKEFFFKDGFYYWKNNLENRYFKRNGKWFYYSDGHGRYAFALNSKYSPLFDKLLRKAKLEKLLS